MSRTRPKASLLAALVLGGLGASVQAQSVDAPSPSDGGGRPPGLSVHPRLSWTETFTDNLSVGANTGTGLGTGVGTGAAAGAGPKDAAFITVLSPGLSVVSNTGRLRGTLDYSLNGISYQKSERPSRLQNSLIAQGTLDVIENAVTMDVRATAAQQAASAFGTQVSDPNLANANLRETLTASVTPTWRGVIAGLLAFSAQATASRTEVRGTSLGDGRSDLASVRLRPAYTSRLSPWVLANTQKAQYSGNAPPNHITSLTAGVDYQPDPDWRLGVSGGRERADYVTATAANGATYGVTAEWTPSQRTQLTTDWHHHGFGDSHSVGFLHRMARLSFQFLDSRSVNLGNTAAGSTRTNYDVYFQLFASIEPDPVKRDQRVREFLQAQGLPVDGVANTGFLSVGPSRLHARQFSLGYQGARSSLTASLSRSQTHTLSRTAAVGDLAATPTVDQRTYSLNLGHRLNETASLSLLISRQESRGATALQSTSLSSITANWTARLGRRLSVQMGGRHSRFIGALPYSENALTANLTQQF